MVHPKCIRLKSGDLYGKKAERLSWLSDVPDTWLFRTIISYLYYFARFRVIVATEIRHQFGAVHV